MSRDSDCGTDLLHSTPGHQLLVQNRHTVSSCIKDISVFSHLIFLVCPATQRWYCASPGKWQVPAHCSTSTWLGITWNRWWGELGDLYHLENGWITRQGEGDEGRSWTTLRKRVPDLGARLFAALFGGKRSGDCREGRVEGEQGVRGERQGCHAQEHWVPDLIHCSCSGTLSPSLHVWASTAREIVVKHWNNQNYWNDKIQNKNLFQGGH